MHIHELSAAAITELSYVLKLHIVDVVPDHFGYWHLELDGGMTITLEQADLADPTALSEWCDRDAFGYPDFTERDRLTTLSLLPFLH
jgi:hypothetical protein